jgi:hypothetical protein
MDPLQTEERGRHLQPQGLHARQGRGYLNNAPNTDFAQARTATRQAATDLYGAIK